ncbi:hypothetical protein QEH59_00675 [Coraliomargarita sp. SDUM461004]|uniref:Uncharacterized protein n=1 Tax=Thalassobacterium sedimentorum TaxID=3041258 RepID=A0ABU1AFM0_9BACT|nr:hypothetical protein [Coraliomargarita sp. SDUM461004]MDQ8192918.1 hypothetical protein [Coraliomargarita sp. SDUM461004]
MSLIQPWRLALLFILSLSCIQAQDSSTTQTRSIRLQLFYWHESNSAFILTEDNIDQKREKRFIEPIQFWYKQGQEIKRVQVRPGQRSSLITIAVHDNIEFYRVNPIGLETIPDSDILRIPVNISIQQGLVLVRGQGKSARANLIDVSDARIPKGALRVVNYTSREITAKVGAKVIHVSQSESAIVRQNTNKNSSLKLMIAELEPETGWEVFYSTVLSIAPERRMLVMVYPSAENSDNLKVKILNIPGSS